MAKTVLEKLGYKPGVGAALIDAPVHLAPLLAGVAPAGQGAAPFLLVFARDAAALAAHAAPIANRYIEGGRLWFAYPKKTGAITTDIHRDCGWEPLEAQGFLAVTQIAIDADWSALRFRRRSEIKTLTRKSERPGAG
jgi:hypothetical protein